MEPRRVWKRRSHVCAVHEWRRVAPREAHQADGRLDNAHACAVQTATIVLNASDPHHDPQLTIAV
eukprot:4960887-Pleurochrysis_carterae.AAC.2